jgi:tetratricopeptide (TPR) repeat protein
MFKKREIFKVKSVPVDPTTMTAPTSAQDYFQRGMAYYARKSFPEAEQDLRQAITLDPQGIEGHYRLGMVLKALDKKEAGIQEFKTVIDLLDAQSELSPTRYQIMRRLALGHMNELAEGDWNLEKEIWQHNQ